MYIIYILYTYYTYIEHYCLSYLSYNYLHTYVSNITMHLRVFEIQSALTFSSLKALKIEMNIWKNLLKSKWAIELFCFQPGPHKMFNHLLYGGVCKFKKKARPVSSSNSPHTLNCVRTEGGGDWYSENAREDRVGTNFATAQEVWKKKKAFLPLKSRF